MRCYSPRGKMKRSGPVYANNSHSSTEIKKHVDDENFVVLSSIVQCRVTILVQRVQVVFFLRQNLAHFLGISTRCRAMESDVSIL